MNGPTVEAAVDRDRLAQAWDWALRLRAEEPDQEELMRWLAWYEADERNKHAFDEVRAFAAEARKLDGLAPRRVRAMPRRRAAWAAAALAASVLVAVVWSGNPPRLIQGRAIETAEISAGPASGSLEKDSYLPDGSHVDLAANSTVVLQYSEKARRLDLRDGVAYFTVAHNSQRPFIVRAGNFCVRAVGTAFNVRTAGDRVVVTVADGTVDVYPASATDTTQAPPDSLRISAGKEIVLASGAAPSVAVADPSHALAWRSGRLEYVNEPLASVIADINRYSPHPIVLRDAAVGRISFSGSVLIRATDSWVKAVPTLFPVDMQTEPDGTIVLSSRG